MTTLKFIINKRLKKNGKHAIYLRITHNRVPTTIETGIDVFKREWQNDTGRVRKISNGSENIQRLNSRLSKLLLKAEKIIDDLEDEDKLFDLSVTDLRRTILNKKDVIKLFLFWEEFLVKKHFNSINTKKGYTNALNSFKTFTKSEDIRFNRVTYEFLKKYERWNLQKGNSYNGFATHLNMLKAIFNEAIKQDIIKESIYPFRKYKVKIDEPEKRSLTLPEFQKIQKIVLDNEPKLERARNLFLISFYLGGISFVDLVKLKHLNLVGNEIRFNRSKTNVPIVIPMNDHLKILMQPYLNLKKNEYIFDVLTSDSLFIKKNELAYKRAWENYNNNLIKLGERCGISKKLTTYVSRHSYATLALNEFKTPLNLVKSSMGHKKINTTNKYIGVYNSDDKTKHFENLCNGNGINLESKKTF